MHKVQIDVVELQVGQGLVQAPRDVVGGVVRGPQLGSQRGVNGKREEFICAIDKAAH